MKLAIVVLSVLTIVAVSADSEARAALKELQKVCMTKTGATAEEVNSILKKEIPQTRPGECVTACMAKAMGVMVDNKLNVQQFKQSNGKPALQSAVQACADVTDADECTAAKQIMACVKQHYKEA